MNKKSKYYSLSTSENNLFQRIIRIVFGILCLGVAIYWLYISTNIMSSNATTWITILFISGFGLYQIFSGIGKTKTYIDIYTDCIILKKNQLLPSIKINGDIIEKIEFYPLSLIFYLRSSKKILLRFGTTFYETNDTIRKDLISFAKSNKIEYEIIEEKF